MFVYMDIHKQSYSCMCMYEEVQSVEGGTIDRLGAAVALWRKFIYVGIVTPCCDMCACVYIYMYIYACWYIWISTHKVIHVHASMKGCCVLKPNMAASHTYMQYTHR